jgi:hypothetical protein
MLDFVNGIVFANYVFLNYISPQYDLYLFHINSFFHTSNKLWNSIKHLAWARTKN